MYFFHILNMSKNVYDGCFRGVATQPSSNSHLEKNFKNVLVLKNNQASLLFFQLQTLPFKVFICGEYRSRTDDLLNANQAL